MSLILVSQTRGQVFFIVSTEAGIMPSCISTMSYNNTGTHQHLSLSLSNFPMTGSFNSFCDSQSGHPLLAWTSFLSSLWWWWGGGAGKCTAHDGWCFDGSNENNEIHLVYNNVANRSVTPTIRHNYGTVIWSNQDCNVHWWGKLWFKHWRCTRKRKTAIWWKLWMRNYANVSLCDLRSALLKMARALIATMQVRTQTVRQINENYAGKQWSKTTLQTGMWHRQSGIMMLMWFEWCEWYEWYEWFEWCEWWLHQAWWC